VPSLPAIPSFADEFRLNGSHIDFFILQCFEETFCERVLGWLSWSRHTDVGADIEEALYIHIATILSAPVGMMNQPSCDLTLGQCHLQHLKRQLRIDATREAP